MVNKNSFRFKFVVLSQSSPEKLTELEYVTQPVGYQSGISRLTLNCIVAISNVTTLTEGPM